MYDCESMWSLISVGDRVRPEAEVLVNGDVRTVLQADHYYLVVGKSPREKGRYLLYVECPDIASVVPVYAGFISDYESLNPMVSSRARQ